MAVEILLEYLVVEDYGREIMNFLKNEFGSFVLIEHFQSFFRIKLNANVSVGKLFGAFEEYVKLLFNLKNKKLLTKLENKIEYFTIFN